MNAKGESKLDPTPYLKMHVRSFVQNEHVRARDVLEQYLLPVGAGVAAFAFSVNISAPTGIAMLTLAALFAAFLFQLVIQLLDRAAAWADARPEPGPSTSRYADLLQELSGNAAYASFVSALASASALAVAISSKGLAEHILAGAAIALFAHLATTLLLVARRVFLLTVARLNDARTGASAEHRASSQT